MTLPRPHVIANCLLIIHSASELHLHLLCEFVIGVRSTKIKISISEGYIFVDLRYPVPTAQN